MPMPPQKQTLAVVPSYPVVSRWNREGLYTLAPRLAGVLGHAWGLTSSSLTLGAR
jgi:hypothetical protein